MKNGYYIAKYNNILNFVTTNSFLTVGDAYSELATFEDNDEICVVRVFGEFPRQSVIKVNRSAEDVGAAQLLSSNPKSNKSRNG